MPLLGEFFDDFRVSCGHLADNEEGGFGTLFGKRRENLTRVSGQGSIIERQNDFAKR